MRTAIIGQHEPVILCSSTTYATPDIHIRMLDRSPRAQDLSDLEGPLTIYEPHNSLLYQYVQVCSHGKLCSCVRWGQPMERSLDKMCILSRGLRLIDEERKDGKQTILSNDGLFWFPWPTANREMRKTEQNQLSAWKSRNEES